MLCYRLRSVLLGLSAWLLISPAQATSYTVVVQNINYFPIYSANVDSGHYSGYVRDLLDAFALSEGIQFNYRLRPIRRMMLEYLEGNYDFAVPDNPNWNLPLKLGRRIHYSQPLLEFTDAVFVRAEDGDLTACLLYTSPSPRDRQKSRMPSSA